MFFVEAIFKNYVFFLINFIKLVIETLKVFLNPIINYKKVLFK